MEPNLNENSVSPKGMGVLHAQGVPRTIVTTCLDMMQSYILVCKESCKNGAWGARSLCTWTLISLTV